MELTTHITRTPLWRQASRLSKDDKIDLIAHLTISLRDNAVASDKGSAHAADTAAHTREMLKKYAGSWQGSETADQIIETVKRSRQSSPDPLTF